MIVPKELISLIFPKIKVFWFQIEISLFETGTSLLKKIIYICHSSSNKYVKIYEMEISVLEIIFF